MRPEDEEIDIFALGEVLWRRKAIVVGIAASCFGLAVLYALLAPPLFRAEAVVTEVQEGPFGGRASSITNQIGGLASLAGVELNAGKNEKARAVLHSRQIAEAFIARNNLAPVLLPDAKKPVSLWAAVGKFRTDVLEIREDARRGVITISIEWRDPKVAADWANKFVALVNEALRQQAVDEAERNIAYLEAQVASTSVVELRRVMYNLIERETKTLMLANVRSEFAFDIVDRAVPPELRSSPRRMLIALGGGLIGGFLGAVAALLLHLRETRRRKDG